MKFIKNIIYINMKIAVIKTGGKQYLVTEGMQFKIEKIKGEKGEMVAFDKVLMVGDDKGKEMELGQPVVAGVKVHAEILLQAHERTVRVVKYKAKTRQHKVYGNRQQYTKIKIMAIGGDGVAKKAPTSAKAPADKPAKKTEEKTETVKKTETKKPVLKKEAVKKTTTKK